MKPLSLRCFNHNEKLGPLDKFLDCLTGAESLLLRCSRCGTEYVFSKKSRSLAVACWTVTQEKPPRRRRYKPERMPDCVESLANKFLDETNDDVDGSVELMLSHFINLKIYKRDRILENAIRHAITEIADRRAAARAKQVPCPQDVDSMRAAAQVQRITESVRRYDLGQGIVEYSLIVMLVSLVFWVSIKNVAVQTELAHSWSKISMCVSEPAACLP